MAQNLNTQPVSAVTSINATYSVEAQSHDLAQSSEIATHKIPGGTLTLSQSVQPTNAIPQNLTAGTPASNVNASVTIQSQSSSSSESSKSSKSSSSKKKQKIKKPKTKQTQSSVSSNGTSKVPNVNEVGGANKVAPQGPPPGIPGAPPAQRLSGTHGVPPPRGPPSTLRSRPKSNVCQWLCENIATNAPGPPAAQRVIHPRKDVFMLKVAKVGPNGDRHCKLELELVTPKGPLQKVPCRVDTRESQCDPDPPPCTCCCKANKPKKIKKKK